MGRHFGNTAEKGRPLEVEPREGAGQVEKKDCREGVFRAGHCPSLSSQTILGKACLPKSKQKSRRPQL